MKEEDKTPPQPILAQLKEYIDTQVKLAKLEVIDKGSGIIGEVLADLIQVICILFLMLFASITLGFFLADLVKSEWMGFGMVFILYLLIFLFIRLFKRAIEKPVINAVVRKFFKHLV